MVKEYVNDDSRESSVTRFQYVSARSYIGMGIGKRIDPSVQLDTISYPGGKLLIFITLHKITNEIA